MKLTVCFGDTKVVVPCGLGNLTVRDLTLSGLRRVRHTLPKLGPQDRIVVHSINVARDGGMLDWDDLVCDVVDDREMVTAHFSIATLSNNVKDSCPNRPSTGLDSIFQSLSTPLVVDLCSDIALEPSFHSPIQSSGASEFRDSGLNLAPPCGIGLIQTDINGHIANRLLRIGDGSTSSSNLSLNLSNDSCGLHQPNGAHTSQFPGDIHEWFLNESSHDSNVALHPNTKVNCVSVISSSDNNKKCFTTSPASQSPPTCFNTASSTCEQMKSSPVSCNKSCLNSITVNDTAKHCQRTLSPNVFEMLSNVLSRRRDLIESGWDSDDEDEDVFDPDGGYSYDCQVGKQQNELVSLPNGDTTLHLDTMNNNSDIIPNSLSGRNHCCLDVTESNSHHENINDNFPTVRYISVTSGTCDRPSNHPVISNADIWPLPPPPFSASDVPHVNIPTNLPFRVHSPEDECHIGINTERLIRAVQSHNSFSNSNGPDRFCTTSDIEPNSLVNQSELQNPLSYSQPNSVTQYDNSIRQQNVQHLSNTHIAENNMVSNSLHQSGPDHVQSQYSHTCNVNSTKSLVITSRPVGGLSCSRTTTRLGIAFQSNLTVPTIVEEEEEYSVDSERRLPNLPENETEHQFIDMLRSRTNSLLNNNHIDINETNEEDYPLLRKDYVIEKDQTSVQKCGVLHVNTINNDKCNPSSNELHLSNVQLHSNDNPLITNNHSIRGLPKPDVIRWLENTRDATMSNNCQVVSQSSLSHLSSSASLNQSDCNTDDHRPIDAVPEKISSNIVESPSVNKSQESINSKDSIVTIRLINTKRGENLGIQIKPVFSDTFNSSNDNCSDNNGGSRIECGLEVHCILPNGRVAREQCLSVGDRILSINGISLSGIPFEKGRDIFQEALNEPEIILRVLPHSAYQYSSSLSIQNIDKIKATATEKSEKPSCGLIVIVSDPLSKAKEAEIKSNTNQLKPIPPPPPRRSPNTVLTRIPEGIIKPLIDEFLQEKKQQENNNNQLPSSQELTKSVVNTQTNTVNNNNNSDDLHTSTYHTIHLCKGSNGLGFSLTSRDSLTSSGQKVICVKNILPGGAALIDGQLKPGDLLVKVDNINVNEIGQAQTVALLRSKPVNTLVTLVVKRSRNNSHNEDINNNNNNNDNSNNTNNDNNLDQACLPDLKTMQPSVMCTIASSCCINTVNEQPTKSILSTIPPLSSTLQPITQQQQHNKTVIVEQPSSHDIKIPDKLSEWNCCSSETSQKFHPLPPSHPSYKLHEIDSSHWSLYLLNIHLPLTKTNESDKITTIRQDTDSTIHQSTIKRHTGNPATLGVSVSVRRLSNNSCVNHSDALGGGLSSSTTNATANEKHSSVQIDKTNDSQWNAVFVRTVIDGGPAYQDGRLQVGDRLLTIDGQNLSGLSTTDALNRLKSVIAKDLNESPHPCVHLLIARPRDETNSDNSCANSMENKSENTINKIISSNQRKSSLEMATKESYNDNSDRSKLLLVSAVVHSSESVSMAGGNSHDSFDPPGKYSLSSNHHLAATNLSPSSSSQHLQPRKKSTNLPNTSYPLYLVQNSQSNEEMSKTLHFKSNTCCIATVNVNNSHETTTKSASSLLLLCNTKTIGNNDENIDVNMTNHHNDANNCNNVTNSPIINNSFQYDPKTVNIDYCAVKNVQIPVTSCSTLKHLDSIPSSNSNGTSEHSHHHYRRRRSHHPYRVNEKFYLNSKCCYSNLDQSSKKRLSNYSSSSTEILCDYQHNLYKYQSNDNIVIDDDHDSDDDDDDMDRDKSSMTCYQCLTDDSDLNYDATTPLSDPETERYSYKLDLFSELSLSSVSGDAGDRTLNLNIKKNPITNKSTSHKCYYNHGKYLSDKKCKYRVVYRQPRIDFSQMVLVPFDPASWNGPVLKPRTALNSEELQLIVDMPNSFSSLQNNNNRVDQQPDKNIERRAHNSIVDVDSMYNKQNVKSIDNEAVRMRKAHPKTVISKLFSLVKTTAHRRTTGDQNTISDFENTAESQLPTDDSVRTIFSSENANAIEKRNNCLINLPNHTNTLPTIQNHLYVESSTKNLLKPQSDQSIDLQLYANNKITNSNERSRSSCYATLHERLEPPIHIYDTAHNIKINNTNDQKSDLSNPSNEQVTLLDAKYPASFAPQINITQTTTENVVVNQPEDTSLTQLQTTKYADLSFLPNSSLNSPLSCMPLLLTNSNNTTTNNTDIVQTTTLFNKTIKDLTSQQQSQHRSISSANQHHLTSLSKSTVNRLYDIEISSCSTAYESVMEINDTIRLTETEMNSVSGIYTVLTKS
ncbi:unnamed protein product [Schistosoma rodhaini]|uniref:PDZ domain-containing protein n=1 Tax=Schistosoma rodhaini TaxID=6188 RepID=A0AA85EW26_9TREM|nr:unnamed protein product [Schistosoma rodhaini]